MFILKCILGLGFIGVLYIAYNLLFPPIQFDGYSMYPTYTNGEIVRGTRLFSKKFKVGEVYVFNRKDSVEEYAVIKRLTKIKLTPNGIKLFFEGDNDLDSIDSREYGYVDAKNVIAKVVHSRPKKVGEFDEEFKCS